jgi:hypothetical protein
MLDAIVFVVLAVALVAVCYLGMKSRTAQLEKRVAKLEEQTDIAGNMLLILVGLQMTDGKMNEFVRSVADSLSRRYPEIPDLPVSQE